MFYDLWCVLGWYVLWSVMCFRMYEDKTVNKVKRKLDLSASGDDISFLGDTYEVCFLMCLMFVLFLMCFLCLGWWERRATDRACGLSWAIFRFWESWQRICICCGEWKWFRVFGYNITNHIKSIINTS